MRSVHVLPPVPGPQLLICKEKHGERYYYLPTEAHLHAVALDIVKERFVQHWYGTSEESFQSDEDLEGLKVQVNSISDPDLRRGAAAELKRKQQAAAYAREGLDDYVTAKKAVETNDGELAWELLNSRASAEYEYVRLESFGRTPAPLARPETPEHGRTWVAADGTRWAYDAKTIKDWIPRRYPRLYYNVQVYLGHSAERVDMDIVLDYERSNTP
jgi:hypothetical protein